MLVERLRAEARKRRPHLAIGCVVAGLALAPTGPVPVLLAAVGASAVGAVGFGRREVVVAAALVTIPAALGSLRIAAIDRPASAAPPGSAIDAEATLLERPRAGLFGTAATMKIESG